jgi:hypothetical protein
MNEFEVYTEYANSRSALPSVVSNAPGRGYPIRIVLRALQNGTLQYASDLQRRQLLADVLKEEVIRQVVQYRRTQPHPWTRARALRVSGFLQGINLVNAASHITSNALRISELSSDFLDEIMSAIHESNMDIDLLEIEWYYF